MAQNENATPGLEEKEEAKIHGLEEENRHEEDNKKNMPLDWRKYWRKMMKFWPQIALGDEEETWIHYGKRAVVSKDKDNTEEDHAAEEDGESMNSRE